MVMPTTPNRKKAHFAPTAKKGAQLFLGCFDSVREHKQYWNKWIAADGWIDIINDRYDIPTNLKFVAADLNRAIGRHPKFCSIDTIGDTNVHGLYKATYFGEHLGKKKSRLTAYYVTSPNTLPQKPGGNTKWYRDMVSTVPKPTNTRQNPTVKRSVPVELVPTKTKTTNEPSAPTRKRRRQNDDAIQPTMNDNQLHPEQPVEPEQAEPPSVAVVANPPRNVAAEAILTQSWWDTGDAIRYFGAIDGEVSPKEAVVERIARLQGGYTTATGWKLVIDDFDQQELCSWHEVFNFQLKCRYVSLALRYAVEDMPSKTWLGCCSEAIDSIYRMDGVAHVKNKETVSRWHSAFRRNNEAFPNPHVIGTKTSLPPLLDRNPELKQNIIEYAKQNLNDLSAEIIYSYLQEVALPELLKERRAELVNPRYTMTQLLKENQLTKLSMTTVFRWMGRLGFRYETRRKTYYVDGHEKPETKKYRKTMVREYLKSELRMHRWIQLPLEELKALEVELEIKINTGHQYLDIETNIEMVELHVDSHPSFHDKMNATTKFGGNLSVRMPPNNKPLICFGQDECIFKQYLFTGKAWTMPDGQKPIIPKDEGLGVMVSGIVSREFGFGLKLSHEDLQKVNEYREGKDYSDVLAAMEKRGTVKKQPLQSSPFVVEFEYGANAEGYWTYDHMVLQFEDCVDVVTVLYPEYDYMFLFDHSCGHDRKRPDGLCANSMRKGFGGKQTIMRDSKIESEEYLGQFRGVLSVGAIQSMNFVPGDAGPYWMTEAEKHSSRSDRPSGKKIKRFRNKGDLLKELQSKGVSAKGRKDELQILCKQNNIPIEEELDEVVEGWEGKPKGMLQILWERGFIDPAKKKEDYTLQGKKDAFGKVIPETSLKHLMSLLTDFIEEETLLQYHGRLMGVKVVRTPKCHPEIAGEGIEYDWGCGKGFYRRLPLSAKKTKNKFRESVKKSLDMDKVLTVQRRRLFSKRAREYMIAYSILDNNSKEVGGLVEGGGQSDNGKQETKPHMTAYLIEKIVKQYKSHRSATDFDAGFINGIVDKMKVQR
jgi:hypothetical protein